ncbi:tetraacyldisaccharide 4'-kinase [Pontivivens ytuae]|uniref:tetraacyldisaccharide 4'-kinase n=1 Tax=Pontivivens ytuae TaxID=2789856 RepID=UPI001E5E89AB|nr:tetraacyldisaccharide 4'-kinase [Pontivivens ytuae]
MSRAPGFWYRPPGLASTLLSPLAALWRWETARRIAKGTPATVGVPVICVGNLTVGGTGKTPTVIALLDRLSARGLKAHVLSRGHGGKETGPLQVDPARHTAADVGDEPLMLSAFAPTWIARDRAAGARAAAQAGAEVIVMDDGFQNPALAKDLSLIVVDGETGFGNGRIVPAGPLREPVAEGIARADLALIVGGDNISTITEQIAPLPTLQGCIAPLQTGMPWQGFRALAFAGIGRPAKFFATLRELGVDVVATRAFGDHEPYALPVLKRLEQEALSHRARLVTTEKDAARLPAEWRAKVSVLPVRLELEDGAALDAALDRVLSS